MKTYAVLAAICTAVVFGGQAAADEYFELFTGTTVWARTSFRIRTPVLEDRCAKTCIATPRCTSFVYGRKTRFCYGRKNTRPRDRRHWHLSRRYDYYKRLTGSDHTRVEKLIPDSGKTEIVFVRRATSRYRDELVEFKRLDKHGRPLVSRTTKPKTTTRPIIISRRPTTTTSTTTRRIRRPDIQSGIRRPFITTITRRPPTIERTRRPPIRTRRPTTTIPSTTTTTTTRPTTTTTTKRSTTTKRTTTITTTSVADIDQFCQEKPIGMEDGTFPADRLSASSSFWRFVPSNGAINSGNGWMASTTDIGEYFEIDFQEPKLIVAVATQGSTYILRQEFVSSYKLKFLLHPRGNFETYKENNKEVVFNGNDDKLTIVKNTLQNPVRAYKMQIHPLTFYNNIMMRLEIYESC